MTRYLIDESDVALISALARAKGGQGKGKQRDCDVIQMRLGEILNRVKPLSSIDVEEFEMETGGWEEGS